MQSSAVTLELKSSEKTPIKISTEELEFLNIVKDIQEGSGKARDSIFAAVKENRIELIKKLLDTEITANGKVIDIANTVFNDGHYLGRYETLLTEAIRLRKTQIVSMLLNNSKMTTQTINFFAHILNSSSTTNCGNPLQLAIENRELNLIKLLLEKGANPDCEIVDGWKDSETLIWFVMRKVRDFKEKQAILALLLKYSKQPENERSTKERIVIEYIKAGKEITCEDAEALANARKEAKEENKAKLKIMALQAVQQGHVETFKFLLKNAFINPNQVMAAHYQCPMNLLMAAASAKQQAICQFLLKECELVPATLNFSSSNCNVLELLVQAGDVLSIELLLNQGALPLDGQGRLITDLISETFKDYKDRNIKEEMMMTVFPYLEDYKKEQSRKREREDRENSLGRTALRFCEATRNLFFCRKAKPVMKDMGTQTPEVEEKKEKPKLTNAKA